MKHKLKDSISICQKWNLFVMLLLVNGVGTIQLQLYNLTNCSPNGICLVTSIKRIWIPYNCTVCWLVQILGRFAFYLNGTWFNIHKLLVNFSALHAKDAKISWIGEKKWKVSLMFIPSFHYSFSSQIFNLRGCIVKYFL